MVPGNKIFLFAVDLEDVRLWMPDGHKHPPRVPENTARYLVWLRDHKAHITFFVVGQVAELYPDLIQEIIAEGHEIALHSHTHVPLDVLGPDAFQRDLYNNLEALAKVGATSIVGYRAPIFSLTAKTDWAYSALAEAGIRYSSSVLPAANVLYGWPGFGHAPRNIDGIWELPISTARLGIGRLPFAGGTYLRLLPTWLVKRHFARATGPVVGYGHPYDIDTAQARFMHPGIGGSPFLNALMYVGRSGFLTKMDALLGTQARLMPYATYMSTHLDVLQP
jgi:polysaccharide deacetylase family protein (PEP-CTERM system associated)